MKRTSSKSVSHKFNSASDFVITIKDFSVLQPQAYDKSLEIPSKHQFLRDLVHPIPTKRKKKSDKHLDICQRESVSEEDTLLVLGTCVKLILEKQNQYYTTARQLSSNSQKQQQPQVIARQVGENSGCFGPYCSTSVEQ